MAKRYMSKSTAKAAIKAAGLSGMVVDYDMGRAGVVTPIVICGSLEDSVEVGRRGFERRIDEARAAKD